MKIIPVIDIYNGKAVTLEYGNLETAKEIGSAVELAKKFESEGADALHIVDLNAVTDGFTMNLPILKEIADNTKIPLLLGGGIRSFEKIDFCFKILKADQVVLGTAAILSPDFLCEAIKTYGDDKIVVACDSRNGKVAIRGWNEEQDLTPMEVALISKNLGCKTILYTDINRAGNLQGINIGEVERFQKTCGMKVIASGGLNSLKEAKALKDANVYAVVVGKALHEGKFTISDLISETK